MARIELDEVVTGLGLLGNLLSIPRQLEGQGIENEQTKLMMKESGMSDEEIAKVAPQPSMRWLSAGQPGFGGKVLGGVGDVGSILSTVVGKPVKAPRLEMSDIANMTTMRTANAKSAAQKRLGDVILDEKSTPRDLAAAFVGAGNADAAQRILRPSGGSGNPPASILGLRGAIENMDPNDPRRPKYQAALDDQLEYQRQQQDAEDKRIRDRMPPHYDPAETERMRHEQIMKNRAADAADMGLKEGTPEHRYYMANGRMPQAPREKAPRSFEEDVAAEQRRRNAMLTNPRTAKQVEQMEPVEDTVRRNRAAREQGKAAEKAGAPIPEAPTPKPKGRPGAAGGAAVGGILGGEPAAKADDTDAQAIAEMKTMDFDALPLEIQQQVLAADKAGMPKRELLNWLLSLQPAAP